MLWAVWCILSLAQCQWFPCANSPVLFPMTNLARVQLKEPQRWYPCVLLVEAHLYTCTIQLQPLHCIQYTCTIAFYRRLETHWDTNLGSTVGKGNMHINKLLVPAATVNCHSMYALLTQL